jgi:hypothetical protein
MYYSKKIFSFSDDNKEMLRAGINKDAGCQKGKLGRCMSNPIIDQ